MNSFIIITIRNRGKYLKNAENRSAEKEGKNTKDAKHADKGKKCYAENKAMVNMLPTM